MPAAESGRWVDWTNKPNRIIAMRLAVGHTDFITIALSGQLGVGQSLYARDLDGYETELSVDATSRRGKMIPLRFSPSSHLCGCSRKPLCHITTRTGVTFM
jgi:hypothetical protein